MLLIIHNQFTSVFSINQRIVTILAYMYMCTFNSSVDLHKNAKLNTRTFLFKFIKMSCHIQKVSIHKHACVPVKSYVKVMGVAHMLLS